MKRFSLSISRTLFSLSSERTIPPNTGTHPADNPVPAPRGVTGIFSLFASFMIEAISSFVPGRTTTSGILTYASSDTSSWAYGSIFSSSVTTEEGPTILLSSRMMSSVTGLYLDTSLTPPSRISVLFLFQLFDEFRDNIEQISDNADICHFENLSVPVLVYCDNGFGCLHTCKMLH